MESLIKHIVSSRRTDKYSDVKQNLWLNSNCLCSVSGVFSETTRDTNSFLGNKKAHRQQDNALN